MSDEFTSAGATPAEEAALERVQFVADLLDEAVEIPGLGYRVGVDPILSVLPVSGDAAAGVLSLYIVAEAARLGVPRDVLRRMVAYVAINVTVGSIPVLGTAFDAVWKANKWNAALLEEHVQGETDREIQIEV